MKTKEEIKAQIAKAVENHSREQLIDMLAEMTHTLHDLQDDIRHMKTIVE